LASLVERTERGEITPDDGLTELDRIHALRPLSRLGQRRRLCGAKRLVGADPATDTPGVARGDHLGLMVGSLGLLGRFSNAVAQPLPTVSAFLVGVIAFSVGRWRHLGEESLRALVPPLALFLPGASIALALI
jgi:hypothetical protein